MGSKLIVLLVLGILEFIVKQFKPTEAEEERRVYAEKIASIVNNFNNGNMGFVVLPSNQNSKWGPTVTFGNGVEPGGICPDKREAGNSPVPNDK